MTGQDPKLNSEKPSHLDLSLDHLFRFVGTVASNLDVETLMEDARQQLLVMANAEKVIIARTLDETDALAINQIGWSSLDEVNCDKACIEELGAKTYSGVGSEGVPAPLAVAFPELTAPWALIPLVAYGRHMGFLFFVRLSEPFDPSTLKLLNTAGRQLAIAAENARLFADVQNSYSRLIGAQEELIRSERLAALGGLAATMAHEIRNPLTTILSSISQIRKHAKLRGDSATLLEIAEEESLRLSAMVSGLLEFARPNMPRIGEVPLFELVDEVMGVVKDDAGVPDNIDWNLKVEPKDLAARVDPELFRRAITLLLKNSWAAVEPNKGRIDVEINAHRPEHNDIEVVVVDNGGGIEPDLQNRVFEPFFTTKPLSTGLGLPVVKRVVEDHGGSVELDSSAGNGTLIRLLFNKALAPGE